MQQTSLLSRSSVITSCTSLVQLTDVAFWLYVTELLYMSLHALLCMWLLVVEVLPYPCFACLQSYGHVI